MDTTTHITMGIGLGALAHLDPAVQQNPELAVSILLCTVIGSNAPDFDYVWRVMGSGPYIRHHRGWSHSLPVLPLWALMISALIFYYQNTTSFLTLFCWTFLAVIIHVLFDLMNVYGTQAGRPFTAKWLSWNFIPLFDPYIITIHLFGFAVWAMGANPGVTFACLYSLLAIYVYSRFLWKKAAIRQLKYIFRLEGKIILTPTIFYKKWGVLLITDDHYQVGTLNNNQLTWHQSLEKHRELPALVKASLQDQNVQHFLSSTEYAYPLVFSRKDSYEVRWVDVRYRNKNHYPYMAVALINKQFQPLSSFTGWIHRTAAIHQKIGKNI